MRDSLRTTRERVDTYTLALMQHGQAATESDIAWLDGLIRAERLSGSTTRGGRKRRRPNAATLHGKERTS